ncbi:putative acetylcholine receptor chaperone [Tachypleus tridentatus]|uniref:putative acetylcholine receptor chaperone n=1 Tax=Tachypleus tridentatus TaxID=6853 RepID=UPI003FCFA0C1
MKSIVLTTLSVFLGLFFIFVGSMKVTPSINREMHREIRRNFVQYAKVFPFAKALGFKVPSKWMRLVVGWIELVCGTTLVLIPGNVKQVANVILLVLMLGAFYTHSMLADKFEKTAPSIVFSLMLGCRLVVFYQVRRKERQVMEQQAKVTTYSEPPAVGQSNAKSLKQE